MTYGNDTVFAFSRSDGRIYEGLSKREYFAAMAMQGMLQNQKITDSADEFVKDEENNERYAYDFGKDLLAHFAAQMADALITELNKQP